MKAQPTTEDHAAVGSRQRAQARTREALCSAGERLFAEKGFADTSLDEIAAAAGYTRGAFHSNFESKADLFQQIVTRRFAQRVDTLTEHLGAGNNALLDIEEAAGTGAAERRRWRVLLIEYWLHALRNSNARDGLAAHFRQARQVVGEGARQMVPETPPIPIDQIAALEIALELGLAIQRAVDPDAIDPGLLFRGVELMVDGLNDHSGFTPVKRSQRHPGSVAGRRPQR